MLESNEGQHRHFLHWLGLLFPNHKPSQPDIRQDKIGHSSKKPTSL
jgi:hypothetical protein